MEYGKGQYFEKNKVYRGIIILNGNKLYLKEKEDLVETYIPLEKVENLRRKKDGIEIQVRLSAINSFTAFIKGERKELSRLIEDLVEKLNLKKKFLRSEWAGKAAWR